MLNSLPVQLIIAICLAVVLGGSLSLDTMRFFFTISCLLKEMLMAVMPFVIFSYISAAILSMERRAPLLILGIFSFITVSNGIAVLSSIGLGNFIIPMITSASKTGLCSTVETINPMFSFGFPDIVAPDQAMLLGIVFGLVFSFKKVAGVTLFSDQLRHYITLFLRNVFIPLLPFYVFGFVLKMQYEGLMVVLFNNCSQVFGLLCLVLFSYVTMLYVFASGFKWTRFKEIVRNMAPAGITGFSTMSSAATMPVTLEATEKNMGDPEFTQLFIPATANIHMIGCAFGVPILAITILTLTGTPLPSLENYLLFAVWFCIARFSVAAIPGGTIIIMLPFLQKYMGLTAEMQSVITTLYILQDCLFTGSNVMANGACSMIARRILLGELAVKKN